MKEERKKERVSHDGARLCVWYPLEINGFISIRTMLASSLHGG